MFCIQRVCLWSFFTIVIALTSIEISLGFLTQESVILSQRFKSKADIFIEENRPKTALPSSTFLTKHGAEGRRKKHAIIEKSSQRKAEKSTPSNEGRGHISEVLLCREKQDWNGVLRVWNTVKRAARKGGETPSLPLIELVLITLNRSGNQFARAQAQRVADEYLRLSDPSVRNNQKSKPEVAGSVVYFSAAIHACKEKRMWKHALWLLDEMERRGIKPNLICYNAAISVCSSVGQLQPAEFLIGKMTQEGIDPDVYTFTSLLKGCVTGRLGNGPYQGSGHGPQWKSALRYLKEMSNRGIEPNVFSYSAAINVFAESRKLDKVQEIFKDMETACITPNAVTFNSMIKACGKLGKWKTALQYINIMQENGVKPDTNSFNSVINACAKAGQFRIAADTFEAMEQRGIKMDGITFNSMIKVCISVKAWREALVYLKIMREKDIAPSLHTYNSVINVCVKAKEFEKAEHIYKEMDVSPDIVTLTTLLHSCCTPERYEKVFYFLDMIEAERIPFDAQAFGAALNSCVVAKAPSDVILKVFQRMQSAGVEPNAVTYSSLVKAFAPDRATRYAALEYLDKMVQSPVPATVEAYNICIDACSDLEADKIAEELFMRMEEKGITPDLITYNSMIKIYSLKGDAANSLEIISKMRAVGVEPSTNSYNGAFKACLQSGNLYQIWNLYDEMCKRGVQPNGATFDHLLRAASQQGDHKKACQFLDVMTSTKRPNLSNYHAVIYACTTPFDPNATLAFSILQQIRRAGLTPNVNSYNGVLAACELKQDLTVALKTLFEMQKQGVPVGSKSRRLAMQILTPTLWSVSKGNGALKKKMNDFIDDVIYRLKACVLLEQSPEHCLNSILFTILFDPIECQVSTNTLKKEVVASGTGAKIDPR